MYLMGLCNICGKPGAMHTCSVCGRNVCRSCFDIGKDVCNNCNMGKKIE